MSEHKRHLTVFIDGGSRGNPGPAASAFIINDDAGNRLLAKAFYLENATNNVAEYTALIKALQAAKKTDAKTLSVFSDSLLLVKQLTGDYKVKSEHIVPLFKQACDLLSCFDKCDISHVAREKNTEADKLVNKALNLQKDVDATKQKQAAGKPARLGVLISGGGTTLMNILEYIKKGELNAQISLVISSRSDVAGVEKAKNANLPVKIIRKKDYPDTDRFSKAIEDALVSANVDLVIQGGWLCLWKIPPRFEYKVMNIHPALLPSFGGQGMWGHHVHEAVLNSGCKVSGCSVHFCTSEYDKGPIIVQRTCPVEEDDTPDTLAARVFRQECIAYPTAIQLFAEGKIKVENGKVKILP